MRSAVISAAIFAALLFDVVQTAAQAVIPAPRSVVRSAGRFVPEAPVTFAVTGCDAGDLATYAADAGFVQSDRRPQLRFCIGTRGTEKIPTEGYRLQVGQKGIVIEAGTETGAFYGLQTLMQLVDSDGAIDCVTIDDSPRYGYRGVMIDVSRHFRTKEFVMKQIDAFARFKLNRLHLHLTDAAGWRIEVKKYPRLTELSAWRPMADWCDWWAADRRYCEASDPRACGGYYTQEDIREIVEYARQRHIEVIPEIEMPAHSEEVFAAYPELSCKGEPYGSADFCPGNESVYTFLEDVLTEVMTLFPSKYIHIGGDEAAKTHWSSCPKCQAVMRREGLHDVNELQSYMIRRIAAFLDSHGRKAVGWDEVIDGGLPDGIAVMSWRGDDGGLKAIADGHEAIMTPSKYCYIDQPQDAPFTQPQAIGGYLPLEKIYSYAADYPDITDAERRLILGVQANLWAEYIPTDEHYERMLYPRVMAIAETGWTQPQNRDYMTFRNGALIALERLHNDGYATFDLQHEYGERPESLHPLQHKAVGCRVSYASSWHSAYPAAGETALTDGAAGGWTYGDGRWQGFLNADFDVTVDLSKAQQVHYIGITFMQSTGPEIFMPADVTFYGSADGIEFELLGTQYNDVPDTVGDVLFRTFNFAGESTVRYIRCVARRNMRRGGWLFADEIVVY